MRYIKLFENINLDDWDYEEYYGIEYDIKNALISDPSIHNVKDIINSFDYDNLKKYELNKLFSGYNKFTKLYDNIDYDRIKRDSVVLCNIINITSSIKENTIVRFDGEHYKIINMNYTVKTYNIKGVISY